MKWYDTACVSKVLPPLVSSVLPPIPHQCTFLQHCVFGFFPPSYCSMFYFSLVHGNPRQGSLILLGMNFYFDLWNLTLPCPLCTHPPLLCTIPFSPFVCVCAGFVDLGNFEPHMQTISSLQIFFSYFTVILFWVDDLLLLFFFSILLYMVFRKKKNWEDLDSSCHSVPTQSLDFLQYSFNLNVSSSFFSNLVLSVVCYS